MWNMLMLRWFDFTWRSVTTILSCIGDRSWRLVSCHWEASSPDGTKIHSLYGWDGGCPRIDRTTNKPTEFPPLSIIKIWISVGIRARATIRTATVIPIRIVYVKSKSKLLNKQYNENGHEIRVFSLSLGFRFEKVLEKIRKDEGKAATGTQPYPEKKGPATKNLTGTI